ncbi:hypothetical protein GGG87_08440 [Streptococcus sp. zg-86]|uniref:Uncharacterized protein n=1 Tax=Streptococcus zhangguiae TaxID=2664091 RepID=A0A6I4RUU4_9STRE|nr:MULTISPECIES: cell wall-active antibiotics response protein LiaF [unclassified Streptococcus]MTB65024.1 hypothetical protein [Streptococcus sp. zg-86]MTB91289.1 hypothetical protein [Streptococcus sp. zg-36]MWV57062.1 hypothetical protein [Streptococcus sp. zg-70]QTH47520.1 hypothetical protein J5M87_08225 [Streptococcus sp. zg-86]
MRKVQFFLLVESVLFVLACFDVITSEMARAMLLFAGILLVIWYVLSRQMTSIFLSSAILLIFLVFAFNPYFLLGVLFMIVYMFINFFSRYEKRNQYTHIILDDQTLEAKKEKTQWFGSQNHSQDSYGFEDVNIIRLFGNDVVDLDETVLVGRDNIVVVRKTFGKTKIIVPIDVEVSLSVSSIYGRVHFLGLSYWDLRNESFAIASPYYKDSHKRVKLVVNCLFGDVEVVRV